MTFPFGISVTVLTRTVTGVDEDNNDVYGTAQTIIDGCAFDPGGSVEKVQGQDVISDRPTLYCPPGTVIAATDQVQIAGVVYDVDGTPDVWQSPFTGWQPGVVIHLKAVSG